MENDSIEKRAERARLYLTQAITVIIDIYGCEDFVEKWFLNAVQETFTRARNLKSGYEQNP